MSTRIRDRLQNGRSFDETDRIPSNLTITNFDIVMYCLAIIMHLVDLGLDINVAVRYSMAGRMTEFGWTLAFILVPAFINTAISLRMYSKDKQENSLTNEVMRWKALRIVVLVLQLAPILRFMDALVYAIKSRRAERKRDTASQRAYYSLMLKEDSDAALLRIFECFLEAAPQQVLQTSLLLQGYEELTVHQGLSIISSTIGMGWCLGSYNRAIRYAQQDKTNMDWLGTLMLTVWHLLVSLSRVVSLSAIAYLFPEWTIIACAIHILIMSCWLQFFDRPPFCSHNKMAEISFSLALGAVYLFTYILPTEGRTRCRYSIYYSICFVQNVACSVIWYVFVSDEMRESIFYLPGLVLSVLPFVVGIFVMVMYYLFLHPKVRKGVDFTVSFQSGDQVLEVR